jgi:hypothetical protein
MKFVKQIFTTDVTLDYNEFIECEIRDCAVLFHGGEFSLVGTKLTNVRFGLGGAANNTLSFMKLIRATDPRLLEELLKQAPVPAPDQSMTVN